MWRGAMVRWQKISTVPFLYLEYTMRRILHGKSKRRNIWNKFGRLRFGILEAQQNHQGRRGMEARPLPGLGRPWAVWSPRSTQPVDAKVIADTFSAFKGLAPNSNHLFFMIVLFQSAPMTKTWKFPSIAKSTVGLAWDFVSRLKMQGPFNSLIKKMERLSWWELVRTLNAVLRCPEIGRKALSLEVLYTFDLHWCPGIIGEVSAQVRHWSPAVSISVRSRNLWSIVLVEREIRLKNFSCKEPAACPLKLHKIFDEPDDKDPDQLRDTLMHLWEWELTTEHVQFESFKTEKIWSRLPWRRPLFPQCLIDEPWAVWIYTVLGSNSKYVMLHVSFIVRWRRNY